MQSASYGTYVCTNTHLKGQGMAETGGCQSQNKGPQLEREETGRKGIRRRKLQEEKKGERRIIRGDMQEKEYGMAT